MSISFKELVPILEKQITTMTSSPSKEVNAIYTIDQFNQVTILMKRVMLDEPLKGTRMPYCGFKSVKDIATVNIVPSNAELSHNISQYFLNVKIRPTGAPQCQLFDEVTIDGKAIIINGHQIIVDEKHNTETRSKKKQRTLQQS